MRVKNSPSVRRVITVDGPAGSGKSTVGRILARKINFLYLDTGAMYRAVALAALRAEADLEDDESLGILARALDLRFKTDVAPPRLYLGKDDISEAIRASKIDMLSSKVSAVKEVREAMTNLQRRIKNNADLVSEGRDMGTVVFPDAKWKFYLTASPAVRAFRRYEERQARGELVSLESVTADLLRRDHQDQTRAIAPLKPAKDSVVIDTSDLTPEEVVEVMLRHLELA
jgi:cytidylate kinase